jgi:oxygen-dependent protoporphyrinogen oxidase
VRLGTRVERLWQATDGSWRVELSERGELAETYDAIVVATPAGEAARLLKPIGQQLAEPLAAIHHSGCCIVTLAYRRAQVRHPLDGFGFVVPAIERRQVISGSFASVKYPGRAPGDHTLIRVFIGGALQEGLLELPDERLVELAARELQELLGIDGPPLLHRLARMPASMPQYYVGHRERVAAVQARAAAVGGLFLTGNAYQGVGIPFCVRGGEQAAQRVVDYLGQKCAHTCDK